MVTTDWHQWPVFQETAAGQAGTEMSPEQAPIRISDAKFFTGQTPFLSPNQEC